MNNKDYLQWYQSLPVYNNKQPRKIEDFNPNEKFEDHNFPPKKESLVTQTIIDNLNEQNSQHPNNQLQKKIKREQRIQDMKDIKLIGKEYQNLFPMLNYFQMNYITIVFPKIKLEIVIL